MEQRAAPPLGDAYLAADVATPAPARTAAEPIDLRAAYERYSPYVAAVALRLLGRDDELDDVVQDVFLEAVRGLEQLRDPGAIRGWFAVVTVRVARRKLRRRRLRAFIGLDDPRNYEHVAAPDASPERRALLGQLYVALDRVPVDERIAWTLRHVEGEDLETVARVCGCSLATAKRRIAAAHARLAREVSRG